MTTWNTDTRRVSRKAALITVVLAIFAGLIAYRWDDGSSGLSKAVFGVEVVSAKGSDIVLRVNSATLRVQLTEDATRSLTAESITEMSKTHRAILAKMANGRMVLCQKAEKRKESKAEAGECLDLKRSPELREALS